MSYVDLCLRDGARHLWMLDEAAGTTAFDSARVADATMSASGIGYRVVGPSSVIPAGVSTDGSAGVITLPSMSAFLSQTTPQAWEAWADCAVDLTTTTTRTLFGNSDSTTRSLVLGGDATSNLANEVSTVIQGAGGAGSERSGWSGFTIPAGWHHHLWTYNGGQNTWDFFLDGAQIATRGGTAISSAGGSRGFDQGATWMLGKVITFFSAWRGLAAVAVYGTNLGPAVASAHYHAGRSGLLLPTSRTRLR